MAQPKPTIWPGQARKIFVCFQTVKARMNRSAADVNACTPAGFTNLPCMAIYRKGREAELRCSRASPIRRVQSL